MRVAKYTVQVLTVAVLAVGCLHHHPPEGDVPNPITPQEVEVEVIDKGSDHKEVYRAIDNGIAVKLTPRIEVADIRPRNRPRYKFPGKSFLLILWETFLTDLHNLSNDRSLIKRCDLFGTDGSIIDSIVTVWRPEGSHTAMIIVVEDSRDREGDWYPEKFGILMALIFNVQQREAFPLEINPELFMVPIR